MRVYLDDDLDSDTLSRLLQREGHEVVSPRAVGTRGFADEEHLRHAMANELVLLTANAQDFVDLHQAWMRQQRHHGGILIVYRENNPARDMSFQQIAEAVSEIAQSGLPLVDAFHNLSFWRRH